MEELTLYTVKESDLIKVINEECPQWNFDNLPETRQRAILDSFTHHVYNAANKE
jgi:hypothetical protein